ncbi:Z-ring formation inhibitor MciZ [Shouchella lonarensis]|uniref:Z-ring formation inhibitor MciZ n=1 Tax=Shouchella lonarensis TaxID=1464122 RepID=A0A1G6LGZ8_9BACI|nr:Z-ring formation inhibitor MciZ [Shouchella lonarensis]SDC42453.1 Protein of unknown function [Shouchella lonarensis]
MHIYYCDERIIIAGKKWEVLAKLKQAAQLYPTVRDWHDAMTHKKNPSRPTLTLIHTKSNRGK